MRRVLRLLDSKPLTRAGAVATIITLGFGLVGMTRAQGADLAHGAGWITLLCFGIWTALAVLLILSWMARRQPSTVATPAARIAIARGAPGSSGALLAALTRAETKGREFIAEAAIMDPVNNQKAAHDLAQSYAAFEAEIASLIDSAKQLDERWSLTWTRKPSWFGDYVLRGPFTLETLSKLVRYMALHNRQLGWMLDFLQGGSDEPVRYARAWAKADEQAADESSVASEPSTASNPRG